MKKPGHVTGLPTFEQILVFFIHLEGTGELLRPAVA